AVACHVLELDITAFEHVDDPRVEGPAALSLHDGHRLVQRERAPVLAIAGQRIETVHGRKDAGANRNGLAFESCRIPSPIPFFVMATDNWRYRKWELRALQD